MSARDKIQAKKRLLPPPRQSDGIACANRAATIPTGILAYLTDSTHIIQQVAVPWWSCVRWGPLGRMIKANETNKRMARSPGLENLRFSHGYGAKGRTPLVHRLGKALLAGDVIERWFARSQGHARGTGENQALNPSFLAALNHSAHP